jgi:hypothetical protein
MTFQAYLDNIKTKTGKTPQDFRDDAEKCGLLEPGLKATRFVAWMDETYGLGRGHAMAIFAVFKSKGWVAKPAARRAKR